MGHKQVEDIGAAHHTVFGLDMDDGHLVLDDVGMTRGGEMGILIVGSTEIGVEERHHIVAVFDERQPRREGLARTHVLAFQVPASLVVPTTADAAIRRDELTRRVVDGDGIPFSFLLHPKVVFEVGSAQQHAGGKASVAGVLEFDEERQVGELPDIFVEIRHRAVTIELLEDDVSHQRNVTFSGSLPTTKKRLRFLWGVFLFSMLFQTFKSNFTFSSPSSSWRVRSWLFSYMCTLPRFSVMLFRGKSICRAMR